MRTMCESRGKCFRQSEAGSLTIFSIFIFILLLMMAGMAVDLVRHERERVKIQNTIDTAVVAASSLTQAMQTEAEVEALIKDHASKAGIDPDIISVESQVNRATGNNDIISRFVNARANYQMDTMFMNLMGIENLPGGAASGAREGTQVIEIALVLDVSGSMGGTKLDNLKTAAKEFVTTVLDNNDPSRTLISIIPYAQQVHMNADLMTRLASEFNPAPVVVSNPPSHPGAIQQYMANNTASNCAHFDDEDFDSRRLFDGAAELTGFFGTWGYAYSPPSTSALWCNPTRAEMLLFQNNETALHNHIDSLSAGGWTAINYGMNWGVGVLDPSFQGVVTGMIADGLAPVSATGFPVPHGTPDILKYVVLMTDGINTAQRDLKPEFKSGPSRVWHSETLAAGNSYNGYLVEMPSNSPAQRWYVPGSPTDTSDDAYLHANAFPADAVQWDHHMIYENFTVGGAAAYFFEFSDPVAFGEYDNALDTTIGYGKADTDLRTICSRARENGWIEIFTVAFEAPTDAENIMRECSGTVGNHFDVAGTQISAAFAAIAAEITKLRLTQ